MGKIMKTPSEKKRFAVPRPTRVKCLKCKSKIDIDPGMDAGEWIDCPECDTGYRLVSLNPPRLKQTEPLHRETPR
jgi:DNA-directed RNA polymerase subunit RPC12/RpoP